MIHKQSFNLSFPECKAELFIPFRNDTNDYSGNNIYVENQNVSVLGNGLGYFNGESRLIISRFANIDFYTDIVVKMRFLEDTQATGLRAMFSNGDCCDNPATMMMVSSKANLHLMAKTEVKKNNTAIDRITTFHIPVMVRCLHIHTWQIQNIQVFQENMGSISLIIQLAVICLKINIRARIWCIAFAILI